MSLRRIAPGQDTDSPYPQVVAPANIPGGQIARLRRTAVALARQSAVSVSIEPTGDTDTGPVVIVTNTDPSTAPIQAKDGDIIVVEGGG